VTTQLQLINILLLLNDRCSTVSSAPACISQKFYSVQITKSVSRPQRVPHREQPSMAIALKANWVSRHWLPQQTESDWHRVLHTVTQSHERPQNEVGNKFRKKTLKFYSSTLCTMQNYNTPLVQKIFSNSTISAGSLGLLLPGWWRR